MSESTLNIKSRRTLFIFSKVSLPPLTFLFLIFGIESPETIEFVPGIFLEFRNKNNDTTLDLIIFKLVLVYYKFNKKGKKVESLISHILSDNKMILLIPFILFRTGSWGSVTYGGSRICFLFETFIDRTVG